MNPADEPLDKDQSSDLPRANGAPTLPVLTAAFARIGGQAFGGLGPALALLERDLVAGRGWLTSADARDALTFTKPLPGSTVVQVVTFLGWRLGGLPGAVLATVAFIAPTAILMTAAAAGTAALPDTPAVRGALLGLQVAVIGLLGAATLRLLRSEASTPLLALTALTAAVAGFLVNAALIVVTAGALAVLATRGAHRIRSRRE